jgi:rhodanese-related sulfurtransferase
MQDISTFIALHPILSLATIVVFVLVVIVELIRAKQKSGNLGPLQLTQLINHQNAAVIDLRTNDVYRKGHIIDAFSITKEDIHKHPKKLEKFRSRPVIFVCNNGLESQKMAALWQKQGYNATALSGGMKSWHDAQLPVVKE